MPILRLPSNLHKHHHDRLVETRRVGSMTADLIWWTNLKAARVEGHGWISVHDNWVNAYNKDNDWVGSFPDLGTATAALEDPRAQDWRAIPDLRQDHGLKRTTGRP